MTWDTFRVIAAGLFGLFGLVLIAVPLFQVVRRRLRFAEVWGFVVAGLGFGSLGYGVHGLPDPRAQTFVVLGVVATVVGNFAQQRIARTLRTRSGR